jgi:hypothetical protein
MGFLNDMKKADSQLRRKHDENQAIFEGGKENAAD